MNSFLAVLYAVAFLANAAASIVWGVRAKQARDELLRAKEAQIELLRELTSTKVFEHFRDTKTLLEDSIRAKDVEIRSLQDESISRNQLVEQLEGMKDSLQLRLQTVAQKTLEQRIEDLEYPIDIHKLQKMLSDSAFPSPTPRPLSLSS
jgi:hypothetical protein